MTATNSNTQPPLSVNNPCAASRLDWMDALKGIGILLVVLGHTHAQFRSYLYSFHMPLFFFISGFLFHIKPIKVLSFVKTKARARLLPYLFFSALSLLVNFLVVNAEVSLRTFALQFLQAARNSLDFNPTLWFLPCLFVIEVLFFGLSKISPNPIVRTLLIAGLSVFGYFSSLTVIYPFSANSALYYLLFFAIGNCLQNIKLNKGFVVLCSLFSCFVFLMFIKPSYYVSVYGFFPADRFSGYILSVILGIVGILGCIPISLLLRNADKVKFWGANSLHIFALHVFVLNGCYYLLTAIGLVVDQTMHVYCLFTTVVCFLLLEPICNFLNKHASFFLGKKPSTNLDKMI